VVSILDVNNTWVSWQKWSSLSRYFASAPHSLACTMLAKLLRRSFKV